MDSSQNDFEDIRRLVADLTTRVYRIERRLPMDVPTVSQAPPAASSAPVPPVQTPVEVSPQPSPSSFVPPAAITLRPWSAAATPVDLESRIGSHGLNRIGLAALLIGVSCVLKFAFENNWIGPARRVTIGLIAGIAIALWSERFRNQGYQAFSYSLKAVGIGTLYLSLWAAF